MLAMVYAIREMSFKVFQYVGFFPDVNVFYLEASCLLQ